ncbi:heterokaryon incompatibility protein-domain-containing protein [Truncatella angustata]|uniref:Heterokaryon incompatibility protein-domain-containing protein n=1 Tax=Truncatella angustata TaxID=152316 RepID=A0A9P8UDV5_9PEZI|nr:heterokaryon incompatibility protein-domain-containing protein [Truncatella angustata]KAH6648114.1 heterokaryon incompatibility protein-domain-containing protein [Truncatella angustata]
MWLIDTNTLELKEFSSPPAKFAMLSHTWDSDEVTFQQFQKPHEAQYQQGYRKIEHTCEEARRQKIPYAWVDTCCIDKTNSAELTESINSMFTWYAKSFITYVFLMDLMTDPKVTLTTKTLKSCRWFTRGWTLQELVASRSVEFYDANWVLRGTKASLRPLLATTTGIDEKVLKNSSYLSSIPVAQRMSWASRRVTTRLEDQAYCLLGIFQVHMPLIYGEGNNAFIRLQEAIIEEVNDLSLFAWRSNAHQSTQKYRGMLASSPAEFADAGNIQRVRDGRLSDEFAVTNKGLRMHSGLSRDSDILSLDCFVSTKRKKKYLGIHVDKHGADLYARVQPACLALLEERSYEAAELFYISKTILPALSSTLERGKNLQGAIAFKRGFQTKLFRPATMQPKRLWDIQKELFITKGVPNFTGSILFMSVGSLQRQYLDNQAFLVVCGMGMNDKEPWATIVPQGKRSDIWELHNDTQVSDMQRMADLACQGRRSAINIQDPKTKINKLRVSISQRKFYMDTVSVHCFDLSFSELKQ